MKRWLVRSSLIIVGAASVAALLAVANNFAAATKNTAKDPASAQEATDRQPLTVRLQPDGATRLVNDGSKDIRLSIGGARLLSGIADGFRIFVDKPDATISTPTSDPHYVDSRSFFPPAAPHNFVVNLTDVIKALAAAGQPVADRQLAITFVVVPGARDPGNEPTRIAIDSLSVSAIQPDAPALPLR